MDVSINYYYNPRRRSVKGFLSCSPMDQKHHHHHRFSFFFASFPLHRDIPGSGGKEGEHDAVAFFVVRSSTFYFFKKSFFCSVSVNSSAADLRI